MSRRCTEGDSLAPRCSAVVYHKWVVERAQGSLEILLKEQKKNQYETKLLHLLHYSAMNLYSNFLREVDLISGPCRSARLPPPFCEHTRRDVTFLDRQRFGQPSKRPCDSAKRAGFSAGGRCFKTTEKKRKKDVI